MNKNKKFVMKGRGMLHSKTMLQIRKKKHVGEKINAPVISWEWEIMRKTGGRSVSVWFRVWGKRWVKGVVLEKYQKWSDIMKSDIIKSKTGFFHKIYLPITITTYWKFYLYHAMIILMQASNTCINTPNQKRIYGGMLKWWMLICILMIWITLIF